MELREKVADLTARFSHIQLDYRDPVPNFDKSRVKGLVINLLKVKGLPRASSWRPGFRCTGRDRLR